jgi:hypothetical protein
MPTYKDRKNYVPHDFNNTVFTINKDHKAEGLESIAIELDEDETTVQSVADGLAQFLQNPGITGTITFSCLEASVTNGYMWARWKANQSFPIQMRDTASPNLKAGGDYCRIMKRPVLARNKNELPIVEWVCVTPYLDSEAGSFYLESAGGGQEAQ